MATLDEYIGAPEGEDDAVKTSAEAGKEKNLADGVRKSSRYIDLIGDYGKSSAEALEREEKRTRQLAKMKLIGDIANVAGQAFVSTRGGRIFPKIESSTATFYDRLAKLGDARRAALLRGDELRLNAKMKDMEQEVAAEAAAKKREQDLADAAAQREFEHEMQKKRLEAEAAAREQGQAFQSSEREASQQHAIRMAAISRQGNGIEQKRTNVVGSDGNIYYITRDIPDTEIQGLLSLAGVTADELSRYTYETSDSFGNTKTRAVDYNRLLGDLGYAGRLNAADLVSRGWTKAGKAGERISAGEEPEPAPAYNGWYNGRLYTPALPGSWSFRDLD